MANIKRVAVVGLGPFGREVEKLLRGDVDELLIVARKSKYLEQFTKDESYNSNVVALEGDIDDIDATAIDDALRELEILPAETDNGNKNSSRQETLDIAIIDMEETNNLNDHVVKKLAPYTKMIIVSTRHFDENVETLEELGKPKPTLVVSPERESAERLIPHILYGLEVRDIIKVLANLYEATIDVPENFTGRSVGQIQEEFGVHVIFFVQSIEEHKGRGKKVVRYIDKEFIPEDSGYCVSKEDTSMRVLGTFSQIKKLGEKMK